MPECAGYASQSLRLSIGQVASKTYDQMLYSMTLPPMQSVVKISYSRLLSRLGLVLARVRLITKSTCCELGMLYLFYLSHCWPPDCHILPKF
jgi:hypothetical protein